MCEQDAAERTFFLSAAPDAAAGTAGLTSRGLSPPPAALGNSSRAAARRQMFTVPRAAGGGGGWTV